MKIKMKYIVAQACLVAGASIALTSCNDFQNTTLCSQHIADGMPVR